MPRFRFGRSQDKGHLRRIHAGRVRAEGDAPDALTWEIDVRTGQRPLLRLIGERYAGGATIRTEEVTARGDPTAWSFAVLRRIKCPAA